MNSSFKWAINPVLAAIIRTPGMGQLRRLGTLSLLVLLLFSRAAYAVNVNAIYTAACTREIGLILNVTEGHIQFLSIEGRLKTFRPYEIIYLAYYPMNQFPIQKGVNLSSLRTWELKTIVDKEVRSLVQGWPIGFTEDNISFLTVDGDETIFNRRNIFSLEYFKRQGISLAPKSSSSLKQRKSYEFVHPYTFRDCPQVSKGKSKLKVYPQQVLSQPVMIKRELDHLRAGYKKISRYHREQKFYGVPEVYKNSTSLGIWHSFGSRYGASSKRTNNITPLLKDYYSSGIFDYQHVFSTGSGPMDFSIIEEPQTHAYYRFKASYFHFSAMVDPNLVLVGRNYAWKAFDLDNEADDRINPVSHLEMGFDYGGFSVEAYVMSGIQYAVLADSLFFEGSFGTSLMGLRYTNFLYSISVFGGKTSNSEPISGGLLEQKVDFSVVRANFYSYLFKKWNLSYSLIYRSFDFSNDSLLYESTSLTNAIYADYKWNNKYTLSSFFSFEQHSNDYGTTSKNKSDEHTYPKAGASISLVF